MLQKIILILVSSLWISTTTIAQNLEVEGNIVLGGSAEFSSKPGTVVWTGSDFMGWNGTYWVSFTSGLRYQDLVGDADGNLYPIIEIGDQIWMVENLRTTMYRNGDPIVHLTDGGQWAGTNSGAWCWYENDSQYELPYGKIYNWYAVNDNRGLCPIGWHVPDEQDWTDLFTFLGGTSIAGGKMKIPGIEYWSSPNSGASNSSGFRGFPAGYRATLGTFLGLGDYAFWWTSTEANISKATWINLLYTSQDVIVLDVDKENGVSVRCLATTTE